MADRKTAFRKKRLISVSGKKQKMASGFLERTLLDIVALLKQTVANDEMATRKGFLQGIDPRFKLASAAVMLVCILITRNIPGLFAFYGITLALAVVSGVTAGYFLKRTLFFIPLFSLFVVVPVLFSAVTPGTSVFSFRFFGCTLGITGQGIETAVRFFLRVLASVSLAILLVLTTRHHVLLKVLRVFRVPQLFIMILGMTYRYIYLLLDIVQNSFLALKSRVGFISSSGTGRKIIGANMGNLWLNSWSLQTRVYDAMLSRGYTGEPKVMEDFHSRASDFILLAFTLLLFAGTLWLNHCTR
jgi:cobalt ECF transporter T component CbiQ